MIGIKDMEMPKGCQKCRLFRKHMFGNGLDYGYSCVLGAVNFPMPWIRQMDERASDCPFMEISSDTIISYLMHKEMGIPISECKKAYDVAIEHLRSQGKVKG